MPELPEVQTVVTTLAPKLIGRRLVGVDHLRSDIVHPAGEDFAAMVSGRVVASLHRRAKRIVFMLDDGCEFYVHLGMTGRLTVEAVENEILPHTHWIASLGNGEQLRFRDPRRFGGIFCDCRGAGELGPEPLAIRPAQLLRRLSAMNRPIKNALMDQRTLAGLGNIYVDESLFAAGIHPLRIARSLTEKEVRTLCRSIKRVLRKAINHRGSTLRDYVDANGEPGAFAAMHTVYGRTGQPCRQCKMPIERIIIGGRSTHYCPRCQASGVPATLRSTE